MSSPVTLKIKFKSASLPQFIERYAADVSKVGIFIRIPKPLAVGTPLRFEFSLQDGSLLLSGDGTVVWTRDEDPGKPGDAPGMGVRFDLLRGDSPMMLEKILSPPPAGLDVQEPSTAGVDGPPLAGATSGQQEAPPAGPGGSDKPEPTEAGAPGDLTRAFRESLGFPTSRDPEPEPVEDRSDPLGPDQDEPWADAEEGARDEAPVADAEQPQPQGEPAPPDPEPGAEPEPAPEASSTDGAGLSIKQVLAVLTLALLAAGAILALLFAD